MAYNVTGAVVYTPSISTVIKNGSAVTITADMTSYKLIDDYGNGGSVYFPSTSDPNTQFGSEITVKCFSDSNGGGSVLSTLFPTLVRVSSQKASITFTPPIGTRSINVETTLYTLVGSETYDYTNSGGYVHWGAPNAYDTGVYYWAAEEPYTACGAPTTCAVSSTLATGNVALSWSGATAGMANPISSYEIQKAESSDGSTWGSWSALTTVTTTATFGSIYVAPPTTAGNYYKFRVRTQGSAGSSYYSDWKESTNTLRRDWTACGAPTLCAVDSTLSLVATMLRWSGATAGYGNTISKYEVQRRSQAPGGSWSAWSAFETTSGTSLSVSPPATAGHYYQYRVRAQGTAGEAYYSGWKESTNTLRKAHKTIPAFTDPTLIVGQTDVKAVHITELQNVMNDILLPFMGVSTESFTKLERDSDAKHWGDHVQEIKTAIDSTGFSHESWVVMQDEVTADVIEQLRRIIKSM